MSTASSWQKRLRYRGFRLLGWSLAMLIAGIISASLVQRTPPQSLGEGKVSMVQGYVGRFMLPPGPGSTPVALDLRWSQKPPQGLVLELQIKDPEGTEQVQKKLRLKPQHDAQTWRQTLNLRLDGHGQRAFSLNFQKITEGHVQFQLTAHPASSVARWFRIGEMLFYPALALVILALVMVLFPSFIGT